MRYLYHGPKRKGRGRPKQFDGRVNPLQLNDDQFTPCAKAQDGSWIAYEAVVNIKAWKRNVRLAVEHTLDEKGQIKSYKLYVCIDTQQCGGQVKHAYNSRFQIEFLYREFLKTTFSNFQFLILPLRYLRMSMKIKEQCLVTNLLSLLFLYRIQRGHEKYLDAALKSVLWWSDEVLLLNHLLIKILPAVYYNCGAR